MNNTSRRPNRKKRKPNQGNTTSGHHKRRGPRPPRKKPVSSINPEDLIKKATVTVEEPFVSSLTFDQMPLSDNLKRNIAEKGFTNPTQIQEETIQHLIDGKNLVGIANTGTGKTGAFLIPIIEQLLQRNKKFQSLIVVPTRELALQVEEEFKSMSQGLGIYSACFIGGTNVDKDIRKLKRFTHLIIGTPGRLIDLMNQGALKLRKFPILVLDEFDKMLDMGFIRDIRRITEAMELRKQTLLFSATVDKKQDKLIEELVYKPVHVSVDSGTKSSDRVNQDIIRVPEGKNKFHMLVDLLNQDGFDKVLVFAEQKHRVNRLGKKLNAAGITADVIHGNKSQNYRIKALDKFKSGQVRILVATDVAARGIDVADVSHVINFQLPMNMDSYIHRIGRTGRAGKAGQAYTFID